MGTRSLIRIMDNGQPLTAIYGQFDGYLSGRGAELLEAAKPYLLSNGIKAGHHNGMGCFAATLIKNLKKEAGGTYIVRPDADGESYTYVLSVKASDGTGPLHLTVNARSEVLYDGPLSDFKAVDPE